MTYHILKIKREFFERIVDGKKTHELRLNDRDYQVGDILQFKIFDDSENRDANAYYEGDY